MRGDIVLLSHHELLSPNIYIQIQPPLSKFEPVCGCLSTPIGLSNLSFM